MNVEPSADKIGGDVGLKIGERQDEVGLQRHDFVDICRVKGLTRGFSRRAHDIAGDPDDAVLFAQQVKRFDRLFGEADNSTWWKHRTLRVDNWSPTLADPGGWAHMLAPDWRGRS